MFCSLFFFSKAPEKEDYITKKGFQSYVDSYSAFWSTGHLHQTELFRVLLKKQVTDVYICGLALDICARFTARDALYLGFNTHLIEDACRSTCPHARCQAKEDFTKDGIHLLDSKDVSLLAKLFHCPTIFLFLFSYFRYFN